jgi:hypothetical protein
MLGFVVAIESEFYPELDRPYRERIISWAARQRANQAGGDDDTAA